MFYAFLGIFLFATFAMMVNEGLWNNFINTFAIVVGGFTAFGLHESLVVWVDEWLDGSYTYLLDFFLLWLTFAVVTGLIKLIANFLSDTRVAFADQLDTYGGVAMGLIAAYLMTGFAMASFHAAPLSYDLCDDRYAFGEKPSEAEKAIADNASPARPGVMWLRLTDSVLSPGAWGAGVSDPKRYEVFDSKIWVAEHGRHRKGFESIKESVIKKRG